MYIDRAYIHCSTLLRFVRYTIELELVNSNMYLLLRNMVFWMSYLKMAVCGAKIAALALAAARLCLLDGVASSIVIQFNQWRKKGTVSMLLSTRLSSSIQRAWCTGYSGSCLALLGLCKVRHAQRIVEACVIGEWAAPVILRAKHGEKAVVGKVGYIHRNEFFFLAVRCDMYVCLLIRM